MRWCRSSGPRTGWRSWSTPERPGWCCPSTSGADKATILEAIDRLEAGGSTAGGAGLRLAYDVARENYFPEGNNRLILATDGDFNVGVSSDAEMIRLVETRREEGTFLTVLGFGTGNLKDTKMEQMADKGNGHYAYIDSFREAQKVFVREFGGTLVHRGQGREDPGRIQSRQGAGLPAAGVREPAAGQGRLCRRQEGRRRDGGRARRHRAVRGGAGGRPPVALGGDSLTYQQVSLAAVGQPEPRAADRPAPLQGSRRAPGAGCSRPRSRIAEGQTASEDLRFASAVAAFALVLRNSDNKGAANYDMVLALARDARGEDPEGYRGEFISMVERARTLSGRGDTVRSRFLGRTA